MLTYSQIIEKLEDMLSQELGDKKIYGKHVAEALDINYDSFRKQKSRNVIPYPKIMSFLAKRNISINWFFFSQLPESLIEETSNYIILKYQRTVIASAGGGAINYEIDSVPLTVDKQLLDHINSSYKYTEVLQVSGESMEPDIKDGSLVFVDKSKTSICSSGVYLVSTNEGLLIKSIKLENNKAILISLNQSFSNIKTGIQDISIIGKVCGVLIKL